MKSQFKRKYEGLRWSLIGGDTPGVERTAIIELQRLLQYYLPYVLPVQWAAGVNAMEMEHIAVLGTAASNRLIAGLLASGQLAPPVGEEGYSIALLDSPWRPGSRLLAVAGTDASGVLYGVQEACARLFLGGTLLDGRAAMRQHLEKVPAFALQERPAVRDRGIWSWGYTIYCYRRFINHMVKLKMNMLTIWNDHVPLNAREIIQYAHERGIRVIFGFHWGWGFQGTLDISRPEDRNQIRQVVLETFRNQYADLNLDGIYFQTLTEHTNRSLAGRTTAAWACKLVNEVSRQLLALYPSLPIQFGLHATSIREDYRDLRDLDERVVITWEDCGSFPFSYSPGDTQAFEQTLEFAKNISALRPGCDYAMVPKGLMCMRWDQEFENHGPFILGERSRQFIRERLNERQNEWDVVNDQWYRLYPLAARFYRELLKVNPCMTVTGLVDDALFEEKIQPSVALFAQTLWNPHQSDAELLGQAMRPYCLRS